MAPAKNKWIRRFIITEIKRHKKGFTIYKVTSMVFLKSSHEEVSKVSVWKRYNDFKKLHSELSNIHKRLGIKESFPILPKSKYFGRFEAEVVEERKKYALKFLEFVGRYSYLYSSDVFITFFETSHVDNYTNDCAHSLNSDTSEDDHIVTVNDSVLTNDTTTQSHFQVPCRSKTSHNILIKPCSPLSNTTCTTNENGFTKSWRKNESHNTTNLQNINIKKEEQSYKTKKSHVQDANTKDCDTYKGIKNLETNDKTTLRNVSGFDNLNSNINRHLSNYNVAHSTHSTTLHEKENLSQIQSDSTQYLLIAAAHMSAAFKHESIAEYEEAFTQYKLGISCLINGVQFDPDSTRVPSIKDKISKYLARAEQLYNRYLNCNISIVSKSVSDLQHYKVLKAMRSVMLVMDIRTNCKRIIKTVEKSSVRENKITDYILRGQIPYMVHLHACVETETTVFLILQYASCGKLWDFIRLHYKTSDNLHNIISNHICANKYVNEKLDSNEYIHGSNKTDKVVQNKLQREDDQYLTDIQNEIYLEVPTMQLLENSQKLLKSVNATLQKSNSITSRLNDFKEVKHSGNISSPNAKAITQISQESDLISSDVYRNKSLNNNIDNILIKDFIENKNSETDSLSRNNNKNSLKNKKSDPYCNNSTLNNISTQNISTNNTIYAYKNNDTGSRDRINSSNVNCTDETQYPHLCKDNIDEEKLWQIPEAVIQSWTTEIILALEALHQQDTLIFDFKPDNILLDDAGHIQLTYITPQHNVELSKLTHPYSSPELTMFSPLIPITSATDIWSLGIILYELFTGTTFVTKHPGLFHSHSTISIPNKLTESAKSLLYGMLKYHPDERLTIDEIKRHPFFAGIDWFSMVDSQA
nr:PREDICTED: ribosomal protein S6 kinase delta-1 [Linepithema humile]